MHDYSRGAVLLTIMFMYCGKAWKNIKPFFWEWKVQALNCICWEEEEEGADEVIMGFLCVISDFNFENDDRREDWADWLKMQLWVIWEVSWMEFVRMD